jgi:hypothetical protein
VQEIGLRVQHSLNDASVCCPVKGQAASQHEEHDDTHGPDVGSGAVAAFKDLWGHVEGRAHDLREVLQGQGQQQNTQAATVRGLL